MAHMQRSSKTGEAWQIVVTGALLLAALFVYAAGTLSSEEVITKPDEAFVLAAVPSAPAKPGAHTTLLAHFDGDDRPDADYARWNPVSAGRDTVLSNKGKFGKAVRITHPKACIIFGGEDNGPTARGTVEMFFRSGPGGNIWADGKERWFAYLGRSMALDYINTDTVYGGVRALRGFSMGLHKDSDNRLVLSCASTHIVTDVSSLDPDAWHHVAIGWDLETHRMYMTVDGNGRYTSMPPYTRGDFSTILIGNHPSQDLPAGCLLDELIISQRPPTERSPDTGKPVEPSPRSQPHPWKSAFAGKGLEKMGVDTATLLKAERKVRMWLDWVVRAQRGGGWHTQNSNIRWPSLLTAGSGRLCYPRSFVHFGKSYNTSHVAIQLCFAYEALGDPYYLKAARRTADLYLTVQFRPTAKELEGKKVEGEIGWWGRYAFVLPDRVLAVPRDYTMIQDFYITGPILTLLYVHKLTGEKKYLEGAIRGGNFLLFAQNPTGSWSHHYDWNRGAGYGTGSPDRADGSEIQHGGELNDQCTRDAMTTLIALWHSTRDRRYLDAFRRAADWVVEAQLDGPTYGWAPQYDKNNLPCWARGHEPPAVGWHNGAKEASDILLLAHHITRDKKYLKPFDRFFAWLDSIRTPTGWYQWYDHKTGRPIAATNGNIYWLDKPEGVKAFLKNRSRSNYTPDLMKPSHYDRLKRYVDDAQRGSFGFWQTHRPVEPQQVVPLLKTWLEHPKMAATFTWTDEHGMKLSDTVAGPAFNANDHGPTKYTLRVSLLARVALGEIGLGQVSPLWSGMFDRTHVIPEPCEFFDTPLREEK